MSSQCAIFLQFYDMINNIFNCDLCSKQVDMCMNFKKHFVFLFVYITSIILLVNYLCQCYKLLCKAQRQAYLLCELSLISQRATLLLEKDILQRTARKKVHHPQLPLQPRLSPVAAVFHPAGFPLACGELMTSILPSQHQSCINMNLKFVTMITI